MGAFDIYHDAPNLLRAESSTIELKFNWTGPTTGRITWNIPTPAAGCAAGTQAYNGMVLVFDTIPSNTSTVPVDGTMYVSDATADKQLHAGSKIGTGLVIGALYDDVITNKLDITGLTPNQPVYVTGYPVDAQVRYYVGGVHTYSQQITNRGSSDTHGTQVAVLNPYGNVMGMKPTDATGLDPTKTYSFVVQVGLVPRPLSRPDPTDCTPHATNYTITIDGASAATYQELVDSIQKQLGIIQAQSVGPLPPMTGMYFWNSDAKQLFQWDGQQLNKITNLLYTTTDPTIPTVGEYWYDNLSDVCYQFDSTLTWTVPPRLHSTIDPFNLKPDVSFYFSNNQGYVWNGTTWCTRKTFIGETDPSIPTIPAGGTVWINPTTLKIQQWDVSLGRWMDIEVIESPVDPAAIPDGQMWFKDNTHELFRYDRPNLQWVVQSNVAVTEQPPQTPAPGKFWFNPTTSILSVWNGTVWVVNPCIVYGSDPAVRNSCQVWLNTITNVFNVWSVLDQTWIRANSVITSVTDPAVAEQITYGMFWYKPSTPQLFEWNGHCFLEVRYTNTRAEDITIGTVWKNDTNWVVCASSHTWTPISPLVATFPPSTIPSGTFWYNPTTNSLQAWNGISWVTIAFTTTVPSPNINAFWWNTTTNRLMRWTGTNWVEELPFVLCEMDCNGNIRFTDMHEGSTSYIQLSNIDLFSSLGVQVAFHDPKPGTDGASDQPSWNELGIGTDGSNEERQLLANQIRYELGYPVVDVELTPEQINSAIDKALMVFRQRSSGAYKHGFFFMSIPSEQQKFVLTNKIQGMNKIVDILGIYRLTSSFLSSAHGAGVYGQIVLQHMYNMGTYDLLSYHIMTEYTKLMEVLFAARLTFTWNEQTRELTIPHRFPMSERMVCIEAMEERSEQDIMVDRYTRPWIYRYALGTCKLMLANVRGKFTSGLAGPNGGLMLNAQELRQSGDADLEQCEYDLESFVTDNLAEVGMANTFIFG